MKTREKVLVEGIVVVKSSIIKGKFIAWVEFPELLSRVAKTPTAAKCKLMRAIRSIIKESK